MRGKCIVSCCGKAASKCCGSCCLVRYCSVECQKEDWKKHHKKFECVNMKKLSSESLTEDEINVVVDKITNISDRLSANGEDERNTDLLKDCIDFVRDRLSRLGSGDPHSLIGDSVKLNHLTICRLLVKLGLLYYNMPSSCETDNHAISYFSEACELLVQRKDTGKDDMVMWKLLFACDEYLCHLHARIGQLEKVEYHAVQFVASARQYKGPDQADHLITALSRLSASLQSESDCTESLAVAEEAYLIASKHYSPAHRMVLSASHHIINCLLQMKDYSTADTYCRMNYANVFDPMNAGEYDVKDRLFTMDQLVDIWLVKEPDDDEIVEKTLADEAIDLSRRVYALTKESDHTQANFDCLPNLCRVLLKANQLTEETEGLLHQLVKYCMAENYFDGDHTLTKACVTNTYFDGHHSLRSMCNLGDYYLRLQKSLPMVEKSTLVQENIKLC